jgi:hypothetical protein
MKLRGLNRAAIHVMGSLILLVGLLCAIWRGILAFSWFRHWRRWEVEDPSIAELYQVNCWFEIAYSLVGLILAGIGLRILLVRRGTAAR